MSLVYMHHTHVYILLFHRRQILTAKVRPRGEKVNLRASWSETIYLDTSRNVFATDIQIFPCSPS